MRVDHADGGRCSPRTWRWSEGLGLGEAEVTVLSTHVEVVRVGESKKAGFAGALHARGGGPGTCRLGPLPQPCSPRTWRWSDQRPWRFLPVLVLSTHVEVVRRPPSSRPCLSGALHARGGGPHRRLAVAVWLVCSPRTWRWSAPVTAGPGAPSVLSTHVEVVRLRSSAPMLR